MQKRSTVCIFTLSVVFSNCNLFGVFFGENTATIPSTILDAKAIPGDGGVWGMGDLFWDWLLLGGLLIHYDPISIVNRNF